MKRQSAKLLLICLLLLGNGCVVVASQPVAPVPWQAMMAQWPQLDAGTRLRQLDTYADTSGAVRGSPEQYRAYLNDAAAIAGQLDDADLQGFVDYLKRKETIFFEPDAGQRMAGYEKLAAAYNLARNPRYEAVALHYLGQENFILGHYGEAFEYGLMARDRFLDIGYDRIPEIGRYLHDLALNYYYFRNYREVSNLMRTALQYPAYSTNVDIQRSNTLALAMKALGETDSAIHYFGQTLSRAEHYNDSTWMAQTSGNLGAIYLERGEYRRAQELLEFDYWYNRTNTLYPDMARNAALSIAEVWLNLGQADSARAYLKRSEETFLTATDENRFGRQQRDEEYLEGYFRVMHQYHAREGRYGQAYRYLDSLAQVQATLGTQYNTMVAQVAENELEIHKHLAAMQLANAERKSATLRWWLVVALLVFAVTALGLTFYLHRLRAAKQRAEARERELQLEVAKRHAEEVADRARAELRMQLEALKQKNTAVDRLSAELEALRAGNGLSADALDDARRQLAASKLLTQEDWHSFRATFNTAYAGALDSLRAGNPDVTPSEERIYALDMMEVPTRQMADILGISPESVRKTRYRLKKKISVPS